MPLSMQAIQKEMNLEKMVKKEEEDREQEFEKNQRRKGKTRTLMQLWNLIF